MYALQPERGAASLAEAADALLLSLEVEAAAARNAELSRTVEGLQAEVERLTRQTTTKAKEPPTPHAASSTGTASPAVLLEEPREVFLALDDLLFELADIRSHLPSCSSVDLSPRHFAAGASVTSRALCCVAEAKKLREALAVSQQSSAAQVRQLQRALGEQVADTERQATQFAVQRAELEQRCAELQQRYDAALAQQGRRVLDRVMQSPNARSDRSALISDGSDEADA